MDDYMGSVLEMIEAEIENGEHDGEPVGYRLATPEEREQHAADLDLGEPIHPDILVYVRDPELTDQEPDGCDDQPDWRLAAIDCRYRASLGYAES